MVRRGAFPGASRNSGIIGTGRPGQVPQAAAVGDLPLGGGAAARLRLGAIAAGLMALAGAAAAAAAEPGAWLAGSGTLPLEGIAAGSAPVPGANTVTEATGPAAFSVVQRMTTSGGEFDKGVGAVSLTVTLSADTSSLEYRVLRAEDDAEIRGWAAVSAASLMAGARVVTCGAVPARLGWLKLQLRSNGSATLFTYANSFGMGRVIALAGQSLATRTFNPTNDTTTLASLGIVPNPNSRVFATYGDITPTVSVPQWQIPGDTGLYKSAGAASLLNDQVATHGVTCALVGHARGSTRISAWIPGGAENAPLRSVLAAVGGFEQFIWFQGHSDAGNTTSPAVYRNSLDLLFADITAYNAVRGADYAKLLTPAPNHSSTSWGTVNTVASVRQSQIDWCAQNGAVYCQPGDVRLWSDGVHQGQPGAIDIARAWSRAMKGQENPRITQATRISATEIRLDVALPDGATALTTVGAPATRFYVYPRGTTEAALALDAATPITISGSTITLKLAADPGAAQALDVYFALTPDPVVDGSADMIRADLLDGWTVGRLLQPTARPVVAGAITPAAIAKPALTMTGAVYEAAASGFGLRLSAGYGATPGTNDSLPAHANWTIEARFRLDAAPGGVRIFTGQRGKGYLGVHGSGRLLCMYRRDVVADAFAGDTTTTVEGTNPIVADGIEHHIAMVVTPQQVRVYLDGVLILGNSNPARRTASAEVYGVNSFSQGFTTYQWTGRSDEHAIWDIERYTVNFVPPAAPYLGSELGLLALWHLDGSGANGVT